jgi:nucleotidyltransferase substrate binding protein (TIGR01987 family)
MSVSLQPASEALKNLDEALSIKSPTKLERDGIVQRFEIAYEQTWKAAQRILRENEIVVETPKDVFRELGRIGWINNVEAWIEFQKSRNETSHEYGEKLAQKSHELAKVFLPIGQRLLNTLKDKSRA